MDLVGNANVPLVLVGNKNDLHNDRRITQVNPGVVILILNSTPSLYISEHNHRVPRSSALNRVRGVKEFGV